MEDLVDHVIAADNINSGRLLRWLSCDNTIDSDNLILRKKYMRLYKLVFKFGGDVLRTYKGPRLIIPVNKWKEWDNMEYHEQTEFAWVVFMQAHQFNREMWTETLWADDRYVWTYYLDLHWETGAYNNLNQIVYKEFLNGENSALKDTYDPDWKNWEDKPDVYLPHSNITVAWDKQKKGWYRNKSFFTWDDFILHSPGTPEGGAWSNQGDPNLWSTPINSNNNSAWGSPLLPPVQLDADNTLVIQPPELIKIEDGSDSSSDSSYSSSSSMSSCNPVMVQSQFLSIS